MARLCGWLILPLLICSLAAQTSSGAPQNLVAIRHVTVIDATGSPARPDMTVTIIGDRIASIAKSSRRFVCSSERQWHLAVPDAHAAAHVRVR